MKSRPHISEDQKNETTPGKPRLDLLKRIDKAHSLDADELVTSCLDQNNFSAAEIYLVNTLAYKLQCDRVSIGMSDGYHIQLSAISNSARFDRKTNLIRYIEAAMDESIDEASIMLHPANTESEKAVSVAHQQLAGFLNDRSICTLPLRHRGHHVGAICLERSIEDGFEPQFIQRAEKLAKVIGPVLHVLHQEQRSTFRRLADSVNNYFIEKFGPQKRFASVIGVNLIAALLLLTLLPVDYRVTANAVLQGSIQRVVAAPVAGYISSSNKRAGDTVTAGDLIATLDDRDLKLEAIKLESEQQQLQREYRESLAIADRSKVSVLSARIKQVSAKMQLVSEQLSRLDLIAPIDGLIIDGDLSQSIGSPVTRGDILYKVAPLNDYRVILTVDESEVSQIENGQTGQLALSALPDNTLNITVTKITPVASSKDGRTFFRVEAQLDNKHQQLQPGMEGIGKVSVGDRKLLWVLTHKVVDRFQLFLWRFWV